jgi:hypothetical protein
VTVPTQEKNGGIECRAGRLVQVEDGNSYAETARSIGFPHLSSSFLAWRKLGPKLPKSSDRPRPESRSVSRNVPTRRKHTSIKGSERAYEGYTPADTSASDSTISGHAERSAGAKADDLKSSCHQGSV